MDINFLSLAGFIIGLVCILLGLAGTILPVVPGLPLAWAGFLIFGLMDKWQHFGLKTMVITFLVAAGVTALDSLAGTLGAKKFGAGKPGMIGSFIGAIIGLLVFNLPGLIIGTFLGAVALEMAYGRETKEALSAGTGALLGFLAGSLFKFIVVMIMLGAYLWLAIFGG